MLKEKYAKNLYFVFRILIGTGFLLHGSMKLFGSNPVPLFSLFGLAGIIEFVGGIFIVVGLFTSFSAFLGAATMIGAWIKVHFPQGINPLENGGELAMIYLASMLVLIGFGSGKYSLEKLIFRKEFRH